MKTSLQLITAIAILATLTGCSMCGNEVYQTVASPSGKIKAVVFNRNCGATTGFNTQVSLVPAARTLPNDGGNTLIMDGTVPLHIQWQSDTALRVTGVGSSRVFKQENIVAGVSVSYGN